MSLFPSSISVSGKTGGYGSDGIWSDDPDASLSIQGSVQPMNGKEIEALPIARTDKGHVMVRTFDELQVSTEGTSNSGDVIEWDGTLWEIIYYLGWRNTVISHRSYVARYKGPVS